MSIERLTLREAWASSLSGTAKSLPALAWSA